MKKHILALLLAAALVSLTGCPDSEIQKNTDDLETENNLVNTTDKELDVPNTDESDEKTESVDPSIPGSDSQSQPVEDDPNQTPVDESAQTVPVEPETDTPSVSTTISGDYAILKIHPVEGATGYEIHINGDIVAKISETTYTITNDKLVAGLNKIFIRVYNESGYMESFNTVIGKLDTPEILIENNILTLPYGDVENAKGYRIYDCDGNFLANISLGGSYDFKSIYTKDGKNFPSIQAYASYADGWLNSDKQSVYSPENKRNYECITPHAIPSLSFNSGTLTINIESPKGDNRLLEETLNIYINGTKVTEVDITQNTTETSISMNNYGLSEGDVITVKSACVFEESETGGTVTVEISEEDISFEEDISSEDDHICEEEPQTSQNFNPPTAKPVIYLYPEETAEISVKLDYNGTFTTTYPAYNDGWKVTAQPDGTITYGGREYYCLFWEGLSNVDYEINKGFCVKGEDTEKFLENALKKLGLTDKEANEFIIYWLPKMENNEYNLISFQKELYTDNAKLTVSPAPDTLIRVFMAWKGSDEFVELEPQTLTAPERTGFTVIEWGGSDIK